MHLSIRRKYFLLIVFIVYAHFLEAQQKNLEHYTVLFYNTENLFHPDKDSLTKDEEFVPDGIRNWNYYKYWEKVRDVFQVIVSASDEFPPAIIGLAEIENYKVMWDISQNTPLVKEPYGIIHHESPDHRGIDIGVLYHKEMVSLIDYQFIPLVDGTDSLSTREIVYLKCHIQQDSLHCFFAHWPSKWGGVKQTEEKRILAGSTLRRKIDSIMSVNKDAKVVIMGDFNDNPDSKSIRRLTEANQSSVGLQNISRYSPDGLSGTHKYQGIWSIIDQAIVSKAMISANTGISCTENSYHIVKPDLLLEEDEKFGGYKPYRTYSGYKYIGGYSDHLPIVVRINYH